MSTESSDDKDIDDMNMDELRDLFLGWTTEPAEEGDKDNKS